MLLIYLYGSRYNISSLQFLDVMNHANNKYFNQLEDNITIDTDETDIRISINNSSNIDKKLLNKINRNIINNNFDNNNNINNNMINTIDNIIKDELTFMSFDEDSIKNKKEN